MTDTTIEPHIIKKTQETLGKFVKKPTLSEKLLKKPPFRFLHDVISVIIRDTNSFNELYSQDELNVDSIKDRDGKISFLQKIIDVVKISTKINLTVRASKIVAGHEPEKTNELLQCIGIILEKNIDCKDAIEIVKNGGMAKQKSKNKEKDDKLDKKTKLKSDSNAGKKTAETKEKVRVGNKEKVSEKSSRKITKVSSVESDKTKREEKNKSNGRNNQVKRESSKDSTPDKTKKSEDKSKKPIRTENKPKTEETQPRSSTHNEKLNGFDKSENKKIIEEEKPTAINLLSPSSLLDNTMELRHESAKNEEIIVSTEQGEDLSQTSTKHLNERKTSGAKKTTESQGRKPSAEKNRSKKDDEQNMSSGEFKSLDISAAKPLEKIRETDNIIPNSHSNSETVESSNGQSEVQRQSTFVREESNVSMTGRPRTSLRPPSARPASARPSAPNPRRRDKNVEIILQPNDQIKLGSVSVKLETFNAELEDDGETLVIIENSNNIEGITSGELNKQNEELENNLVQQGHLVQQILETQKELVHTNEQQLGQKPEKEFDSNITQNRQSSGRQVDTLKDAIQVLTKSINPLGKLMDFIPEDIDSMQLELTMWRDNYTQAASELRKEKSLTENATEPMKIQLTQIEASIKEYQEMIDTVRSKIIQNTEKIHRLLTEQ